MSDDSYHSNWQNGGRESSPDPEQQEPEREPSIHNDGQGIQGLYTFQPTHPPLAPGTKRRSNARLPKAVNTNGYFHEDSDLEEFLDAALKSAKVNPARFAYKIVGGNLRTNNVFSLTYSIANTQIKDQVLETEAQFEEAKKQAAEKGRPSLKLLITEHERVNDQNGQKEDTAPAAKRLRDMTEREKKIAEAVERLQQHHFCADRRCTSRYCFLGNPKGVHVRITPPLFKCWATNWVEETPDVDIDNPPQDEKDFWPEGEAEQALDDVALLTSRRARQVRASDGGANVTIHLHGIGDGDRSPRRPSARSRREQPASSSPAAPAALMTMVEFGAKYKVAAEVALLETMELDGPHLLSHIDNSELEVYLTINQRARIRFAEKQWKSRR